MKLAVEVELRAGREPPLFGRKRGQGMAVRAALAFGREVVSCGCYAKSDLGFRVNVLYAQTV